MSALEDPRRDSSGRAESLAIAIAALLVAGVGDRMPLWMGAALLLPLLAWAPGALLVAWARLFEGGATRAAASFALSPFLVAAPWAALCTSGLGAVPAARVVLLLLAGTALIRAARPGGEPGPKLGRPEALVALAWTAVVAALLFSHPALPPRADGWFHAGVVWQIADRGLPPEDPYFAGLPLLYFWGTHAWAAMALSLVPSLGVWLSLITLNLGAAAATLLAIAGLTRALGGTAAQAGWASMLVLIGWTPFGWVQVAGRALVGEVRGWPEVQRLVDAGIDPMLVMLADGQLHASMAFQGDKALVLTPFGMGLALLVLGLVTMIEPLRGRWRFVSLAVVIAAALFTHTVVGYALLLASGVWVAWALASAVRGEPGAMGRAWGIALAAAAALALLAPYVISITAGKQGQVALAPGVEALRTALGGTGVFLAGAALWWWRGRSGSAPVLLASILFLVLGLTLELSENNQSKFFNLLAVSLSAPAAMGLHAWATARSGIARLVRVAFLAALLLPTPSLALWAFAAERGQAAGSWHEPSPESRRTFAWARANTAPPTMFADLGGARELFTISGRSVLWGGADGERDWGHPPAQLEIRRRAVRALCTGAAPDAEAAALLNSLARPIVVVCRASLPATDPVRELARREESGYRVLQDGTEVMLVSWEPSP